jgi:DNA-binding beta-propeller fold protein YncE
MGKRKSVRRPLLEEEDEQGPPLYQGIKEEPEWTTIESPTLVAEGVGDGESRLPEPQPHQYSCTVTGPGVEGATANHPTHVFVELRDLETSQPCTLSQSVTAEIHSETAREEKSHHHARFKKKQKSRVSVDQRTTATYRVSFTAVTRGEHQLHVRIDGVEIEGSPCNITVYTDPNQLRKPIGEIPNRTGVWGAAVNSRGEIIASNYPRDEVVVINSEGEVIVSYDCRGPTGVTIDGDDNVYVSCVDHIEKYSRDGHLVKSVGKSGHGEGEFISPEGLVHHKGLVYICDTHNNRIQIYDTDLNYVKTMGCLGCGNIEFDQPWGIDFDSSGRAYVADKNNSRVQVIDVQRGGFLKEIGHSGGKGKLSRPSSVHVVGEFLYVSDDDNCRVAVFRTGTGEFVTSFGGHSDSSGKKYRGPFRICSDRHEQCLLYVLDLVSARIF